MLLLLFLLLLLLLLLLFLFLLLLLLSYYCFYRCQIVELVKSEDIGPSVKQMLWEMFTMKIPNTSPEESRGALSLIAMVAG